MSPESVELLLDLGALYELQQRTLQPGLRRIVTSVCLDSLSIVLKEITIGTRTDLNVEKHDLCLTCN